MKFNKLTSALVALGVLSLAALAQANTTNTVYFTGSTAARSVIYNAAKASGQIFTNAATVIGGVDSSSSGKIVYQGNLSDGSTLILNCSWTGSEAGIAAVAGQSLTQSANGGTYGIPGVPASYLTAPYSTASTASATHASDLAMADSSQTVSLTSKTSYPLAEYGIVGIVPFTTMKGYMATPTPAWSNIVNVTTAVINQNMAGPLAANIYTGNTNDAGENVVVCGRNLGSGTRVNSMLSFQQPVTATVDQFAFGYYPTATPGVLTFGAATTGGTNYTAAANALLEVGNDGFDSGGNVKQSLQTDGTGAGALILGYLGIADAAGAGVAPTSGVGGGAATYLPFNGVYESDSAVINGTYTYWGQEHLYGTVGQSTSSAAGVAAAAIKSGIVAQLISSNSGKKTGAVGPTYTAQSAVIPTILMQVKRSTDGGFPAQATYGY